MKTVEPSGRDNKLNIGIERQRECKITRNKEKNHGVKTPRGRHIRRVYFHIIYQGNLQFWNVNLLLKSQYSCPLG